MTLYGPDISNNNGSGISMAEVAREGFSFVFCKVTQGSTFQDATWPGYRDAAHAAGLLVAGYHFADTSDPAAQVANYQRAVGDLTIPVMIDFETGAGTIADYWALVQAFNDAGQRVALSYLPQWYWASIGSPDLSQVPGLIASAYPESFESYASTIYADAGGDAGEGWNAYGNATPVLWQFTDQAIVAGNVLDANAFRGDIAQLSALLGGNMDTDDAILQQLAGPEPYNGWPQLGNRTVVDALATIGAKLGIDGFTAMPGIGGAAMSLPTIRADIAKALVVLTLLVSLLTVFVADASAGPLHTVVHWVSVALVGVGIVITVLRDAESVLPASTTAPKG